MKVKFIKQKVSEHLTPTAWQRVLLRILPDLNAAGLFLHNITDDYDVNGRILEKVRQNFIEIYKIDILQQ